MESLESEVETLCLDLDQKVRLIRALREESGIFPRSRPDREALRRLCRSLLPDHGLCQDHAEIVITSTQIFLCLPELDTIPGAPPTEIAALKQQLKEFPAQRFKNFPSFGFVQGDRLDSAFVTRLARRAQVEEEYVRSELPRAVTVLMQADLDKYIVHDTWGHGWQATLLQFEKMFDELAVYARAPQFPSGLASRAQYREYFVQETLRRLPAAVTGVFCEMLADMAEFKVIDLHPRSTELMPSSSLFKNLPTKFDLTLGDITSFYRIILKAFDKWAKSQPNEGPEAVAAWLELREGLLKPELGYRENGGRLEINLYTRLVVNFLTIHQAILTAHASLSRRRPGELLPLKTYRDLMVIGTAVFFEQDRLRNIWRLDEFLILKFIPLCLDFEA